MQPRTTSDQIEQELRTTIEARRELGPAYDDPLIEAFVQKLSQHLAMEAAPRPQPLMTPTAGQRLSLAIVSAVLLLGMAIPIAAVAGGGGLFLVSAALVAINAMFSGLPTGHGRR